METIGHATLAGREVELRQVGIGVGLESNRVREATGDNFRAGLVILAGSAFWKDDGTKVFADLDAVINWPMVDFADVAACANEAGRINKPKGMEERVAKPNGAAEGEGAAPSS